MLRELGKYIQEFRVGFVAKGSFTQNLTIAFSGNMVSQALGFVFTPFIARVYGPEIYGLFALFLSIANNISPIATLQFPSSYVAAKNENEFQQLLRITFLALVSFTIFSFFFTFFFNVEVLGFLNAAELKPFIYLIPVYFFFMGVDNILLGWNIRRKEFKRGAIGKILSTSLSKGITLAWGLLLSPGALGMIIGNLFLYPFETIMKLNRPIRSELRGLLKNISWSSLKIAFYNFRMCPFFVLPGVIISNLGNQLPVYYFSATFNQTVVGYFALASSLVMLPISIISLSSTTVFLQKAAEVQQYEPEQLKFLVGNLYKRLFYISVVPLVVFALLSDLIFGLLFGSDWVNAGVFAAYLAMGAIFSVPSQPLSVLFRLKHYERTNLIINIAFIFVKFAGLLLGVWNEKIVHSIIGFSIASMLSYTVYLFWIFKMVNLEKGRLYRDIVIVGLLFFLIVMIKS